MQKGVRGLVVGFRYVFMLMFGVVGAPWYAWLVGNGVGGDGDDMYMGVLNVYLIW